MNSEKISFQLEVTKPINDFLVKTAIENDTNEAEVLRFALDFLNAAVKAKKDNFIIGAWKKDEEGNIIQERIFTGL